MSQKEELITQLNALSEQLGRKLPVNGSLADLQQRVREAQEELAEMASAPEGTQEAPSEDVSSFDSQAERVHVTALVTLHTDAFNAQGQPMSLVLKGESCWLAPVWVPELSQRGLIQVV
ncbi:DNA-packaging protein FI [Plesiomonas shigelloides]|uniref:DNA-packaging protein FI n=1 Tax=Plesiomonas shigelloides TaxID=703 RepID=UPI0015B5BD79|nr:DNA-packaging protein FI [Plesiomonas shigelloides]